MKTRLSIVCVGIILFALLGISQAQAPALIAGASTNSRITVDGTSVRVYSAANLFSTGRVNGFTNVALYGQWTFGGGSNQVTWGSAAVVKSSGTFASSQGSYAAICEVSMSQETMKVGYVIKRADTGAVLRTSSGMKPITWGTIAVKPPMLKAGAKKK